MTKPRTYKPRRSRMWLLAFALLTVLGLFVLDGPLAGVAVFLAFMALLIGCIMALAGHDTRKAEFGNFIGG